MRSPVLPLMLCAALLAGCGDSEDGGTTSTADTTASTSAQATAGDTTQASTAEATPVPGDEGAPAAEPPASPAPPAEAGERFIARVANGNVRGGPGEWEVDRGDRVTIVVESDESDEIHVHGYDETADIAGGSGQVTFEADIEGVFEVELEESHLPVGTLQVNP